MQTSKLGLTHELAGKLERLFRSTTSRSQVLNMDCRSLACPPPTTSEHDWDPVLDRRIQGFDIVGPLEGSTTDIDPSNWPSKTTACPPLSAAALTVSSFELLSLPAVHDLALSTIKSPAGYTIGCDARPKRLSTKGLDITWQQRPISHTLSFSLHPATSQSSLPFAQRIPIIRHPSPAVLQEKPLLRICWRKAVQKTRRTPQQLQQLAVFSSIPLSQIKKIEFELHPISLKYWLVDAPHPEAAVTTLVLFRDQIDDHCFLTSSSDER